MNRQKPIRFHSMAEMLEVETRKHLTKLKLAIPDNLPAVIDATDCWHGLNFPPDHLTIGSAPSDIRPILKLFREGKQKRKSALMDCLNESPGTFLEIIGFVRERVKFYTNGESLHQRIRTFLLQHGNGKIHIYYANGRTNYFCNVLINSRDCQQSPKGNDWRNIRLRVHEVKELGHEQLAFDLKNLWGVTVKARDVEEARKSLR